MISFANVTKSYGSIVAVDRASFVIEAGEYFALLGPNGAGKTTLVKMALDLVRPSSGQITIGGLNSRHPSSRQGMGYLAENHRIPPYLSGREYLVRQALLSGIPKSAAAQAADEAIVKVGMQGEARRRSSTYSKGMTQRIGLAGALIGNPRILILDEPSSGLDPIGIREIRELLEGLRSTGITVCINSHLLSEVERMCDTAAIMSKGKVLVKDRIDTIVSSEESLEDVFVRLVRGSGNA